MSKRRTKKRYVNGAFAGSFTLIATAVAVRSVDVDPIIILAIGIGLVWLWGSIIFSDYDHPWIAKATRDTGVRLAGATIIVWVIVWMTYGDSDTKRATCAVPLVGSPTEKVSLTDPESEDNKYVRVTKVTPRDSKYHYAVLIEFGVTRLWSEGVGLTVNVATDTWEEWCGKPNSDAIPDANTVRILTDFDSPYSSDTLIIDRSSEKITITPHRSYYLCLLSYSTELREPNDILYFAVEMNKRTSLSPTREALGHQYQMKK